MRSGISFERGEIVFVPFPFTNLRATKKRPVLILSRTDYNKKSADFISCGITSKIRDADHSVLIESKDLSEGFLPSPSQIKVGKIFTLEKNIAIRSFGKVKEEVMKKVRAEFNKLF